MKLNNFIGGKQNEKDRTNYCSESTFKNLETFTTENSKSPSSSAIFSLSPFEMASSNSSVSYRLFSIQKWKVKLVALI